MKRIRVRHEEVAAFAAAAEPHLTGHLAVCADSSGLISPFGDGGSRTTSGTDQRSAPMDALALLLSRLQFAFTIWGEGLFVFPLMLVYNAISYGVFHGKVRSASGNY
jgi:hypothetical protein